MADALLAFSIGPVQEFIAAARTTRDLWTGSYLLSWLTAHALAEVGDEVDLIVPSIVRNALYAAVKQPSSTQAPDAARLSTLPNTFVARVPAGTDGSALAQRCREAVEREWAHIESEVHAKLKDNWDGDYAGWDERWTEQVSAAWDVRTTVLSASDAADATELRRLLGWEEGEPFALRLELLARLAAADKQIRHYPPDETEPAGAKRTHAAGASNPGDPDIRPKDSMLGTWAQMGPRTAGSEQMRASREFWEGVRRSIDGTRIGERDRLSAVSLVKRFAWSVALAPRLNTDPRALRFADIHTIAAREWLERAGIDWQRLQQEGQWSGYWLRWESSDQAEDTGEQRPSAEVWKQIQDAKDRKRHLGAPPSYYAVLMIDGDRMGDKVRNAGREERLRISAALGTFAAERVPRIVEEHGGELVYAGGDDVLALLPLHGALACARQVAAAFRDRWTEEELPNPEGATVSGGLVVAHAMEDLRAVLGAARETERRAKEAGRNRLALSVRRRSGEHVTTVPPRDAALDGWALVPKLEALVSAFRPDGAGESRASSGGAAAPASSRWAYAFREQLERLPPDPALRWAELTRLLGRAERTPDPGLLHGLWAGVGADRPGSAHQDRALDFVQLVQSAAFIARSE